MTYPYSDAEHNKKVTPYLLYQLDSCCSYWPLQTNKNVFQWYEDAAFVLDLS